MKGGSGVSTAAALTALAARKNIADPVTLVDLCGDQQAVFGRPPAGGIAEWASMAEGPEGLDRALDDAAAGVELLGRGAGPLPPDGRAAHSVVDDLLVWMAGRGTVVIDAGDLYPGWNNQHGPGYDLRAQLSAASDHTFTVIRRCWLATRRAPSMPRRASGLIVVDDGGDLGLESKEIAQVIGAPVAATVPVDALTARSVAAGMIAEMAPDSSLRSLGGMVDRLRPTTGLAAGGDWPHQCDVHDDVTISDNPMCSCRPGGCVTCAGPVPVWADTTATQPESRGPVFRCDNEVSTRDGVQPCGRPIIEWVPAAEGRGIEMLKHPKRARPATEPDAGIDPF